MQRPEVLFEMVSVTASAEFFCRSLGWGLILFSFLANAQETGVGLKKLIAGIASVALFLGILLYGVHGHFWSPIGVCYFLGLMGALSMFLVAHDSKVLYTIYTVSVTALFLLFADSIWEALFSLSSAALLGIIAYAMVLGHWYLVTPRLSNVPLLRAFVLMGSLLAVKLIVAGYGFWEGPSVVDTFGRMLVIMRMVWGYAVVGGMGYFGYRLAKMRSIQSATGILYAMTFAVFIGELGSHYLYHHYGLYL